MHRGNLHLLRRRDGAQQLHVAGHRADLPLVARALDVHLAGDHVHIHLVRVAGDELAAGDGRHRDRVRAGADRRMAGHRRHGDVPRAGLRVRLHAHAAGGGGHLHVVQVELADAHVAAGRGDRVAGRIAARHAHGDSAARLLEDGEERLEHVRILAADGQRVAGHRDDRLAVGALRLPERLHLRAVRRHDLHVIRVQLDIDLVQARRREGLPSADRLARVAHDVLRRALSCIPRGLCRLMDHLFGLARHLVDGFGKCLLVRFAVPKRLRCRRPVRFRLLRVLSVRLPGSPFGLAARILHRVFHRIFQVVLRGSRFLRLLLFLFRSLLRLLRRSFLVRAEVEHQLAVLARKLVNGLFRGLLRVAHALPGRAAQLAQHAAGRVVHLAVELLRLRHDRLAKVAQRGERLVQRVAQIGLGRLPGVLAGVFPGRLSGVLLRLRAVLQLRDGLLLRRIAGLLLVHALHLLQQAAHVLQRRGNLHKGLLLALALRDRVLIARLRVGHQLVAQREVLRRHLHLGKNFINHAANPFVHHRANPPFQITLI